MSKMNITAAWSLHSQYGHATRSSYLHAALFPAAVSHALLLGISLETGFQAHLTSLVQSPVQSPAITVSSS